MNQTRDRLSRPQAYVSRLSDVHNECLRALAEVFTGPPSMTYGGEAAGWIYAAVLHHGLDRLCDCKILDGYGDWDEVITTWGRASEAIRGVLAVIRRVSTIVEVETSAAFVMLDNGQRPIAAAAETYAFLDDLTRSGLSETKACVLLANLMSDGEALPVQFVRGDSTDRYARR